MRDDASPDKKLTCLTIMMSVIVLGLPLLSFIVWTQKSNMLHLHWYRIALLGLVSLGICAAGRYFFEWVFLCLATSYLCIKLSDLLVASSLSFALQTVGLASLDWALRLLILLWITLSFYGWWRLFIFGKSSLAWITKHPTKVGRHRS